MEGVFEGKQRDSFSGDGARAHDEGEAENLVQMALQELSLDEEDLETLKKGADEKALIAWLIRKRTVVQNRWIANRLSMGAPAYVSMLVKKAGEMKGRRLVKMRKKLEKLSP